MYLHENILPLQMQITIIFSGTVMLLKLIGREYMQQYKRHLEDIYLWKVKLNFLDLCQKDGQRTINTCLIFYWQQAKKPSQKNGFLHRAQL